MTNHTIARFDAVAIHADAYIGYPTVQASIFEANDTGGIIASPTERASEYHSRLGTIAMHLTEERSSTPKIFCFL